MTNNVVATDSWHGISMNGVDGLLVANNTVIATDGNRPTWIAAGGETHQGAISRNVTVRNNIATAVHPPKGPVSNMQIDHNLVIKDPRSIFVAFDAAAGLYDFHLRSGTLAVGGGLPDAAPQFDADRSPRGRRIDLGAFQAKR